MATTRDLAETQENASGVVHTGKRIISVRSGPKTDITYVDAARKGASEAPLDTRKEGPFTDPRRSDPGHP